MSGRLAGVLGGYPAGEALGLPEVERHGRAGLDHAAHPGEIGHRVSRGHISLVGVRDGSRPAAEQFPGLLLAQPGQRLGGQVLIPRTDRGGQLGFEFRRVHLGQPVAALGPHHHVQPGQRRVADGGAVLDGRAAERLAQDLLGAQPHRGGVAVPGQVHQAGHVAAVHVPAQEEPGLAAFPQRQHAQRDRGQLGHGDLEQLLARVPLEDLGQVLAVVAVRGHPGRLQHAGQLAPQHRDAGDALVVRGVGEQPQEAVLADHLAGVVDPLDRDVVQVGSYRSFGQQRNFLLGGESGMGKTSYLDWFTSNYLPDRRERPHTGSCHKN